jgi:DNA-binding transcriptional ArsR family regulator
MSQTKDPDSRSYAEAAALTDLLGNNPRVKIIAVLLKEGRDVNATQIADLGGMSRSSVYEHLDPLITLGVIEKTREIGGSPLYQINKDSTVAKKLAEVEMALVEEIAPSDDDDDFEIPDSPPNTE